MEEIRKFICDMSEEQFEEFCKQFTAEQVKIFQAQRFFNKLFNDPQFYNAVCKSVGEVAYEDLRR